MILFYWVSKAVLRSQESSEIKRVKDHQEKEAGITVNEREMKERNLEAQTHITHLQRLMTREKFEQRIQ